MKKLSQFFIFVALMALSGFFAWSAIHLDWCWVIASLIFAADAAAVVKEMKE